MSSLACVSPLCDLATSLVFVSACSAEESTRLESGRVRSNPTLARIESRILHHLELSPEHHAQWTIPSKVSCFYLSRSPIRHPTLSTPEDNNDLLADELSMTMAALRERPKVYWIWNHRRWCLENVPDGPMVDGEPSLQWRKATWQRELAVVEKMLDADARNCKPDTHFVPHTSHILQVLAWNYRRYVLASMPDQRPITTELAYTTRKISASFSNFSAWHQRSKVYSLLWNSGEYDPVKSREEGMCLLCL